MRSPCRHMGSFPFNSSWDDEWSHYYTQAPVPGHATARRHRVLCALTVCVLSCTLCMWKILQYVPCVLHTVYVHCMYSAHWSVCIVWRLCCLCSVHIFDSIIILSVCMVVVLKALSAYCRVCCVHYIVCTALYVSSMLQVCIDIKFLLHPYSDLSPPLIWKYSLS